MDVNPVSVAVWLGAFVLGAGVASILWAAYGPRKRPRYPGGRFAKR